MASVTLAGSARAFEALAHDPDPLERLVVSLHLRPANPFDEGALLSLGALPPGRRTHLSAGAAQAHHGASPEDLAEVARFAHAHGLSVIAVDGGQRRVELEGDLKDMAAAFGFSWGETAEGHRVAVGNLLLPEELAARVTGVLGLDARPRLRPHVKHDPAPGEGQGFTPVALAERYAFPAGSGKGQRVGLIELGGGYRASDMEAFFSSLNLPVPKVRVKEVLGATNAPDGGSVADRMEVTLDLQVLGALVPEAELVIYFAPNTDQGFMTAIQVALADQEGVPQVLSISWGHMERGWAAMDLLLLFPDLLKQAAAQGVTLCVSSGDHGSRETVNDGKAHVNFPASSPWVLACGGTTVAEGGEVVWNSEPDPGATGGGISDIFELPEYQKGVPVPASVNEGNLVQRGVPDVAANADRATGYRIFVDGAWIVAGGTSAAAPLWAALIARCNELLGTACGFLNPYLYADAHARAALTAVPTGHNGDYHAAPVYSACTGLGTPDGGKLLAALRGDHLPTA